MTWAKLDDRLYDDPRCERAGVDALGLYVLALSYMGAYATDGWIALDRCRKLVGRRAVWLANKLVDAGLWERPEGAEDAFRLVGWERALLPSSEVTARAERAAAAGRRGGRPPKPPTTVPTPVHDLAPPTHPSPNTGTNLPPNVTPNLAAQVGGLGGGSAEVPAGNVAKSFDTPKPTRAPDPDPTRPDRARERARSISYAEGEDEDLHEELATSGQTTIAFGPSDEPAPHEEQKPPRRSTAPLRGNLYLDAFCDALEAEGRPITRPPGSAGALLGRVAKAHAKRGGTPIVGDELLAWFGDVTRRFVRAIEEPKFHRGGISPYGLSTWLDSGALAKAEPKLEPKLGVDYGPGIRADGLKNPNLPPGYSESMLRHGEAYARKHGLTCLLPAEGDDG
jgi:hypothetical protein